MILPSPTPLPNPALPALRALALLLLPLLVPPALAALESGATPAAQSAPRPSGDGGMEELRIVGLADVDGILVVPLVRDRGFTAISAGALADLGWTLSRGGGTLGATRDGPGGGGPTAFRARSGNPFLLWDGERVQLAHAPYERGRDFFLPLQLVADVLPNRFPERYVYDAANRTLRVLPPGRGVALPPPSPISVVVIDPGHGGHDPGARGAGGAREKDVALAIGLALARELEKDPDLEVHLIRDGDVYIHPWERGEIALGLKEDRPGVFISIHANALPSSRNTRGFETYFLSEARTEHERRVAAVENAPIYTGRVTDAPEPDDGLTSILRELRQLDDQHWSALLAEMIQDELARVHPGPNRGVKQGPLAVLTNALMPSVLVEVGFITHREEERLLGDPAFQGRAAASIAEAVRSFFLRYPPGRAAAADR